MTPKPPIDVIKALAAKHKTDPAIVGAIIGNGALLLCLISDAKKRNEPKIKITALVEEFSQRWLFLAGPLKIESAEMVEMVAECTKAASELLLQNDDEAGDLGVYNLYKEFKI